MTKDYCINCGYGAPFDEADNVVERCNHCPRLEAYKNMFLYIVWYSNDVESDFFVGVYTSEAKAKNDGRAFVTARRKLVYLEMGRYHIQNVEPNKMTNPKTFR